MINDRQQACAFAPATTSNLAVGFDILGFPLDSIGDEVSLQRREDTELVIQHIDSDFPLPMEIEKNTATVAIEAMQRSLNCQVGLDVSIKKGIPLGSGLGGSAASSVAAVVAFNQFLNKPLAAMDLIPFALAGEKVATGSVHADNVVPCLLGGLVCIHAIEPLSVIKLPTNDLWSVFIHPHVVVETKQARAVLPKLVPLTDAIQYSARLAAFIAALYSQDRLLLSEVCKDELIEPHRQSLIPHFKTVQQAAFKAGALACSISGAGPTLFALSGSKEQAAYIGQAMGEVYEYHSIPYDSILSTIAECGARSI
ncbi:homoserine kinase [Legionella sp. W05-934-2]|jgi:homoserine kinase|uniref:homoserine kinase n=1 Tax=Legionella sp. W05-934-2 TaxID=1198649 RepID=UPI0034635CE6